MVRKLVDKYNKMALPAKAGLWFMICSIIPQIITVIMTTIFTRILSTNDYGISSNYSAWYSIISIFITLNLNCGVYNIAMMKYENNRNEYTSSMMGLSLLLGVIGGAILLIFRNTWASLMQLPVSLIVCLALQCLLYNPYGCWLSRVRYEYNYKSLIKITILISVLSPLLSVVFILLSNNKAVGKVWGQNVIYIIVGCLLYIISIKKGHILYNKEYWKFALIFNLPLIPHYLALVILNQSDRVMITSICGASDNGLYSVAYSAASLLLILNSGITQAMTPWIYTEMKHKNINNIRKYTSILCFLYVVIDILFVMLAPEAISILAGNKYSEAVYVIPPVATGMYFIFLYNLYSIVEFYYEKTKPVMICSTISAVLNIVLNYIFIPKFGFIAAAYTTLACYLINACMHSFVLKRIYKNYLKSNEAININITGILGIVLSIVAIFISTIYKYFIIRWGIVFAILLVFVEKRKQLLKLIKKIKRK